MNHSTWLDGILHEHVPHLPLELRTLLNFKVIRQRWMSFFR